MQYFASFETFEVFEEFNGVAGTYIKSFLISDKINLNDWQATHEANISNLDSFLGKPGIHYINPEGKRDHTSANTFEKSLQIQDLYSAASIIAVGSDIATHKNWQISKMVDDSITAKIKSKEIQWISPSIWPEESSVEQIEKTDGKPIDKITILISAIGGNGNSENDRFVGISNNDGISEIILTNTVPFEVDHLQYGG